jgi:hypothetical protein
MVLGGQEGDSVGVRGLKERYWIRFLKGMVTDRNTTSPDCLAKFVMPMDIPFLIFLLFSILSYLLPSPFRPFPYIPQPSITFHMLPLLS